MPIWEDAQVDAASEFKFPQNSCCEPSSRHTDTVPIVCLYLLKSIKNAAGIGRDSAALGSGRASRHEARVQEKSQASYVKVKVESSVFSL